jgi:hypothetical protein
MLPTASNMAMFLVNVLKAVLGTAALFLLGVLWLFREHIRTRLTTRLKDMPGPDSESIITGNLIRIFSSADAGECDAQPPYAN